MTPEEAPDLIQCAEPSEPPMHCYCRAAEGARLQAGFRRTTSAPAETRDWISLLVPCSEQICALRPVVPSLQNSKRAAMASAFNPRRGKTGRQAATRLPIDFSLVHDVQRRATG